MDDQINYFFDLNDYKNYLDKYYESFEKLEESLELQKEKVEIVYFVDFSEIQGYFFPLADIRKIEKKQWRSDNFEFFQFRVALSYIFEDIEKLFILPPHNIELNNYLNSFLHEIGLHKIMEAELNKEMLLFHGELKKKISNYGNFKDFYSKDQISNVITEEILIQLIENYYFRLKAFRNVTHMNGIATLNNYLNNSLLKYKVLEEQLNISTDITKILHDYKPWFYYLLKNRPGHTDYANYNDSLAAVYIHQFNKYCIDNNIPKIGILITRARTLSSFIDNLNNIEFKKRKYSFTRGMEYFIIFNLYTSLLKANRLDIFNILKKDFYDLRNDLIYSTTKEIPSSDWISNIIPRINNIIDALGNYRDLVTYLGDKVSNLPKINFRRIALDDIYNIFLNFLNENPSLENEIDKRQKETNKIIKKLGVSLKSDLQEFSNSSSIEFKKIKRIRKGKLLRLKGLKGEMPTLITFRDINLSILVERIFTEQDIQTYNDIVIEIKKESAKNYSPEFKLLESYIYACLERWEESVQIIDESISKYHNNENLLLELYYLESFLCRKMENLYKGYEACINGLKIKSNDPRLLRERGVLIWQCYNSEQNRIDDFANKFNEIPNRELAFEYVRQALENSKMYYGKELKLRCLNSLAYISAESNDYKDIVNYSEKYLDEIEKMEPSKFKLPSRFSDTKGFVKYRKCMLGKNKLTKNKRVELLREAIKDIEFAKEIGGIIGRELTIVQGNLFNCLRELNLLEDKILPYHV